VLQRAVQRGLFQARLAKALTAAFGRPVQVSQFRWVPWDPAGIEAENVTVGEFPAFGQEYFLRAERVVIHLRWDRLLRRQFQIAAMEFDRPSLNLVRVAGKWNVETWLGGSSSGHNSAENPAAVEQLEIHDGRINFKRGLDKLPFALIGVNGRVRLERSGRWMLHLQGAPMRAGVSLQDVGVVELSGEVGARSRRLLPLQVVLRWSDASISDLGRLLVGRDPGIRGRAALQARLEAQRGNWQFTVRADVRGLHRWDLAARPDNPAFLLQAQGSWDPATKTLRVASGELAAPQSQTQLSAQMHVGASGPEVFSLRLEPMTLSLADLLSFYRAFHPGVDEQVSASGWVRGAVHLSGWPPWPDRVQWSAQNLVLRGPALTFHVGSVSVSSRDSRGQLSIGGIQAQGMAGQLQLHGRFACPRDCRWSLVLQGHQQQISTLRSTATALGWPAAPWWEGLEGTGNVLARWQGRQAHVADWTAVFELQRAGWQVPALASPLSLQAVTVEARPRRLRIVLQNGHAFGTEWSGRLERRIVDSSSPWHFALYADHLSWTALRAGSETRPRVSWFERLFGKTSPENRSLLWLLHTNARGAVRIEHFQLAKAELQQLGGQVETGGGSLSVSRVQGRLAGGRLSGAVTLRPGGHALQWKLSFRGDALQLNALMQAFGAPARLKGTLSVAGSLSGDSADPRHSLSGKVRLSVLRLSDPRTDWLASLETGRPVPGSTLFARVQGSMVFKQGQVALGEWKLLAPGREWVAEGTAGLNPPGSFALHLSAVGPHRRSEHGSKPLEPMPFQVVGTVAPWRVALRPIRQR
jgi:hypothetical protein